jgi:transcriptional regulator with AAA-type ATPase domain
MRAVQGLLPLRDYGEDALAEESLTDAIEHAAQQANEPVLIEGPHGTGKLYYARQIFSKLFPAGTQSTNSAGIPTNSNYHVLSPLTKPKRVLALLAEPGVVVFYRADEFKRKLQIELLRIVSELDLPDGKPLKAKMIFLLSESGENCLSPRGIPGFQNRLRNACIYIKLKNLVESNDRIPDLIRHHLRDSMTNEGEERSVHADVIADFKRSQWDGNLPQLHRVLREMLRNARNEKELTIKHYPVWFERPGAELDGQELARAWFVFELLKNKISIDDIRDEYAKKFGRALTKHHNTYKKMAFRAAIQKGEAFDAAVEVLSVKKDSEFWKELKKLSKSINQKGEEEPPIPNG